MAAPKENSPLRKFVRMIHDHKSKVCILVHAVGSGSAAAGSNFNWMPAPQAAVPDCPTGLEYLVQIDRLLVSRFREGIPAT